MRDGSELIGNKVRIGDGATACAGDLSTTLLSFQVRKNPLR